MSAAASRSHSALIASSGSYLVVPDVGADPCVSVTESSSPAWAGCRTMIKGSNAPHSLSLPDLGTGRQGELVLQPDRLHGLGATEAQPQSLTSRRTTETVQQQVNPPSRKASLVMATTRVQDQ
jgi:hypothetical protein